MRRKSVLGVTLAKGIGVGPHHVHALLRSLLLGTKNSLVDAGQLADLADHARLVQDVRLVKVSEHFIAHSSEFTEAFRQTAGVADACLLTSRCPRTGYPGVEESSDASANAFSKAASCVQGTANARNDPNGLDEASSSPKRCPGGPTGLSGRYPGGCPPR